MRRTLWMLAGPALGAIVLAGCGGGGDGGGGGVAEGGEAGSEAAVALKGFNNSNEFGTASVFSEEGGKTRILMDTEGPFDREFEQPAAIYKGTCPNPTGQPAYELTILQDGVSETTIDAAFEDLQAGGYVIVVRKSATDDTVTQCGPIVSG
jgi:hypothetical protein